MRSMTLDFTQTLAFAGLVLFIGYGIKRAVPLLTRYNLPAPVIGGLLVALLITATRRPDWAPITFDTALQPPLMIAFFTTSASPPACRCCASAGRRCCASSCSRWSIAVVQNVVGAGTAPGSSASIR